MIKLLSFITLGLLSTTLYASEISASYVDYNKQRGLSYNADIDIYSNFSLIAGYTKINADKAPSFLGLGRIDITDEVHIFEDKHKFLNIVYGLKYTYHFNDYFSTHISTQQMKTSFTDSKVITEDKSLLHSLGFSYQHKPFSLTVTKNRLVNYKYIQENSISFIEAKIHYFISDNVSMTAEYSEDSLLLTDVYGIGLAYSF